MSGIRASVVATSTARLLSASNYWPTDPSGSPPGSAPQLSPPRSRDEQAPTIRCTFACCGILTWTVCGRLVSLCRSAKWRFKSLAWTTCTTATSSPRVTALRASPSRTMVACRPGRPRSLGRSASRFPLHSFSIPCQAFCWGSSPQPLRLSICAGCQRHPSDGDRHAAHCGCARGSRKHVTCAVFRSRKVRRRHTPTGAASSARSSMTWAALADSILAVTPGLVEVVRSFPVPTRTDDWGPIRIPLMAPCDH